VTINFEGKNYDTSQAVKVSIRPGVDSHQELMQTPDGDYFLVVRRVLLNRHRTPGEANGYTERFIQNQEIVPLSASQALEWCLKSHIPQELHRYLPEYLRTHQEHSWG
jgi:hypothetical protein